MRSGVIMSQASHSTRTGVCDPTAARTMYSASNPRSELLTRSEHAHRQNEETSWGSALPSRWNASEPSLGSGVKRGNAGSACVRSRSPSKRTAAASGAAQVATASWAITASWTPTPTTRVVEPEEEHGCGEASLYDPDGGLDGVRWLTEPYCPLVTTHGQSKALIRRRMTAGVKVGRCDSRSPRVGGPRFERRTCWPRRDGFDVDVPHQALAHEGTWRQHHLGLSHGATAAHGIARGSSGYGRRSKVVLGFLPRQCSSA